MAFESFRNGGFWFSEAKKLVGVPGAAVAAGLRRQWHSQRQIQPNCLRSPTCPQVGISAAWCWLREFPKSSGLLACGSGFGGVTARYDGSARWDDSARKADLRQICLRRHGEIHGFRGESPVSSSVRRFPCPITERSETGPGDGSKPKTKLSVITRQPPLQAGTVIAILPGSFLGKSIHRFTSRTSFGFEIGVLAENRHAKAKDT